MDDKECLECIRLKEKIAYLEDKLFKTTDLQQEVDRLRIALAIAEKEL